MSRMFIAIDKENGQSFGPFESNGIAVAWVHGLLLHNGEIKPEDDQDGLGSLQEDLMDMGWLITEVIHVDTFKEDYSEYMAPGEYLVVMDDGTESEVFPTHEAAVLWALTELTNPRTKVEYSSRATELLASPIDLYLRVKALDLIHEVDWIVIQPAVWKAQIKDYDDMIESGELN